MPNRKNSTVCDQSTTPRRSPRLNPTTPNPKPTKKKSPAESRSCPLGLRRSPRFNKGVRRSPRFSDEQTLVNGQKREEKLSKSVNASGGSVKSARVKKGPEAKKKETSAVANEGIAVEDAVEDGGKGRGKKGVSFEVTGKTKRGSGGEIHEGWTKEQELALQRAYFSAKPSPHFWKNVSKQVPGKTQQDCFDRIHHDYMTPPQPQPRSRAKAIDVSPLHKFSISASKLLKPIDKTVKRSKSFKQKSFITQKAIEDQLQRNFKVDRDRQGDIFSVLEPNIDIPTNALQPSPAFSTPKQLKENRGLLQSCTETSSSSHKKTLSRFSGSHGSDIVSPPVLKQVKNRVQHEKYIHQLRCREARRKAASARTKKTLTGKMMGEGSGIVKKDAVKEAKVALVSEAKDAINKFQQSQANFMDDSFGYDEDNDDGFGAEYESP